MKFKEAQLTIFASPISDTEDEQCKNAIRMVRDALKCIGFSDNGNDISKMYTDSYSYQIRMQNSAGRDIKIFVQGSYANGTNIRSESDVDLAVVQENVFRTKYRPGVTDANYNDYQLSLLQEDKLNVLTIHAEAEGGRCSAMFDTYVKEAKKRGFRFITLGEVASEFSGKASAGVMKLAEFPGREGELAVQMVEK